MKIKQDEGVRFDSIKPGQAFTFGREARMKVDAVDLKHGQVMNNVTLGSGSLEFLKPDDYVVPHPHAEVTL